MSVKEMNHATIIDTPLWYGTWQLSGYNPTHVKQKLPRRPRRAWWSSWSRRGKPKVIYTDNSWEFGKSCEELSWNHCASTPHRSETDGIAERAVRGVKEGTSAVLLQSSLDNEWWADSMECCCYLWNIQDLVSDGRSPYERRFGMPFNGPAIPFGAMVEYHPISAKDISRRHQFGPKVLPGLFLGYVHAGGHLERRRYGRRHWRIGADGRVWNPRQKAQRKCERRWTVTTSHFPVADGTVRISGGARRLRTSTLIRDRPERGEEKEVLRGKSDGLSSPSPLQDDSTLDDAEARYDFWSIAGDFICRHHVEPRVEQYVPREESFLIPMKYIDVTRNTHTSLDVMMEKILMIIGTLMAKENYQMHGRVSQDSFCWMKGHLTDIRGVVGETDEETNDLKTRQCVAGYVKAHVWLHRNAKKSKNEPSRNPNSIMPEDYVVFFFIEPDDEEFKRTMKTARRKLEIPMPAAMLCKTKKNAEKPSAIWGTQDPICLYCRSWRIYVNSIGKRTI